VVTLTNQRFQPDDYHVHKKFLLAIRKPGDVNPEMFLSLLRYHNRLLALLPGAPADQPELDDDTLVNVYLDAMPAAWRENFENANLSAQNSSIEEIKAYMKSEETSHPRPFQASGY
jgi:hypothetical protein